jgi:hypothetical protein
MLQQNADINIHFSFFCNSSGGDDAAAERGRLRDPRLLCLHVTCLRHPRGNRPRYQILKSHFVMSRAFATLEGIGLDIKF